MKKWITHTNFGEHDGTVFKVNKDLNDIAQSMGYSPVYIFRYDWDNEPQEVLDARIDGITAGFSQGDLFVHLFPTRNGFRFETTLIQRLKDRGVIVALAIIDSQKLHYPEAYYGLDTIDKEHLIFENADYLIVHSKAMAEKLKSYGVRKRMLVRGPFEFLMQKEEVHLTTMLKREITFIGDFVKSPFLSTWDYETPLSAFGFLPEKDISGNAFVLSENVKFMGAENYLERIPRDCFGIFWDEGGNHQNYSQYTSPHKVALYLSLGLPVIVWEGAGIAPFIKENQLGIIISSLNDIDKILEDFTDDDLYALKHRVNRFSYFMRQGIFTRRVLSELEMKIEYGVWPEEV